MSERKKQIPRALTNRDRQVLELSAQGMRTKDIAQALNISRFTVNTHVRNIYDRTGSSSLIEAYAKTCGDPSKQLSEFRRLFLDEKSPVIKWHKTEYRQPVNRQQVLMKYEDAPPLEGYYIASKWFTKSMVQVEPPVEWTDASLASFESEVAA